MMKLSSPKKVALLVETSLGSGREILRGIGEYAHHMGNFQLIHYPRGLEEGVPAWMEQWGGDGIIARVQTEDMATKLGELSLPVVDVLGVIEDCGFPLVHVDDDHIGRVAANYFTELGFLNFGFVGIKEENWSEKRRDSYIKALGKVAVFEVQRNAWETVERIAEWVQTLEKPTGVLVASDQVALALVEACRVLKIAVPEQVSVLGVDNDAPLCEISSPQLSSIRAGHFRVGVEAGRLLDQMMRVDGDVPTEKRILVPPGEIVIRSSTDSLAIHDPVVALGINFVRRHFKEPLTNEVIAKAVGVSRTLFQKRFLKETGKTIRQFLIELRLKRAKQLVMETNLPLVEIADLCGFRHQEYMGDVFKRNCGMSPGQFRKAQG